MVIWVLVATSARCTSTESPSSQGASALPLVSITRNVVNTAVSPNSWHARQFSFVGVVHQCAATQDDPADQQRRREPPLVDERLLVQQVEYGEHRTGGDQEPGRRLWATPQRDAEREYQPDDQHRQLDRRGQNPPDR